MLARANLIYDHQLRLPGHFFTPADLPTRIYKVSAPAWNLSGNLWNSYKSISPNNSWDLRGLLVKTHHSNSWTRKNNPSFSLRMEPYLSPKMSLQVPKADATEESKSNASSLQQRDHSNQRVIPEENLEFVKKHLSTYPWTWR